MNRLPGPSSSPLPQKQSRGHLVLLSLPVAADLIKDLFNKRGSKEQEACHASRLSDEALHDSLNLFPASQTKRSCHQGLAAHQHSHHRVPIKRIPPSYKPDAEPQGSQHHASHGGLGGCCRVTPQPREIPPILDSQGMLSSWKGSPWTSRRVVCTASPWML